MLTVYCTDYCYLHTSYYISLLRVHKHEHVLMCSHYMQLVCCMQWDVYCSTCFFYIIVALCATMDSLMLHSNYCYFTSHLYISPLPVMVCLAVVCSLLVCLKLRESKLKETWTSSTQSRQQEHRDHTWSTPL